MGKFDGVLLVSDFDNTLVYTEDALRTDAAVPELSAENRRALEYFTAEGGRFTVATGRALAAFQAFAGWVPMNVPGVVCNGAAIYDFAKSEYMETALLDGAVRERGQQVLDAFPSVAVEVYHLDNEVHTVQPNAITRCHEHITRAAAAELPSLLEAPLPLGKLLFEAERPDLSLVKQFLEERGWAGDYEIIFSGETLLELTRRGANKGGMVLRLAERLGVSREHVYCVGDEANDLSMLRIAAEGFAPANCIDAVRRCGATLVADARDGALAEVVSVLDRKYGA